MTLQLQYFGFFLFFSINLWGQGLPIQRWGGPGGEAISHACLIKEEVILVAGTFQDSMQIQKERQLSQGLSSIFLIWLNKDAAYLNSISLGNVSNNQVLALCSDSLGASYLAGTYTGLLECQEQQIFSNQPSCFLAKIDASGKLIWLESFQNKGAFQISDLQWNAQELWLTGSFNDSLSIQGQSIYQPYTEAIFVAKINSEGKLSWLKDYGKAKRAKGKSLAPLANGNCWVAAEYHDSLWVNSTLLFRHPLHSDLFLFEIDANGRLLDYRNWGGAYNDQVSLLRLSPDKEHLWLVGQFVGILRIDSFELRTAFRYYDIFWVKLDLKAHPICLGNSNSIANAYAQSIAFEAENIILGGYFQDSIEVEPFKEYSKGGIDAFYLRLDLNTAKPQNLETWGGKGNDLLQVLLCPEKCYAMGSFQDTLSYYRQNIIAEGFSDAYLLELKPLTKALLPEIPAQLKLKLLVQNKTLFIEAEDASTLRWELYQSNGKRVASGKGNQISLDNLAEGIYSLQVRNELGAEAFEKLVIQKEKQR